MSKSFVPAMDRTYSGDHLLRSTGGAPNAVVVIEDAIKAVTTVPRRTALPSVILVRRFLLVLPRRTAPRQAGIALLPAGMLLELYVSLRLFDTFSDHGLPVNASDRTLFGETVRDIK